MKISYRQGRYLIHKPYNLGPRLMPSLGLSDGSRVSIVATGRDPEGRVTYSWAVDDAHGHELATGEDLHSGVGGEVDVEAMFRTFASFVGAWVESFDYPGSDNAVLFPPEMQDWSDANHEELWMLTNEEGE